MTTIAILQLLFSGLAIGSIYGLVALSYNAIFSTTYVINFSQGEFVSVGALLGFSFYVVFGLPVIVALALAAAALGLIAILLEFTCVRPIKDVSHNFIWIMSTFAFGIVLRQVAMLIWGKAALPFPKFIGGDAPVSVGGVVMLPQEIGIIAVALICTVAFELYKRKTLFGTAVRATALDRETASLMGINTNSVVYFSYAISGSISAISGFLVAPITFADPTMGIVFSVKGFVALILGGLGNAVGGVLGGLLLGTLEAFSATFISTLWKDVITFLVLILVMLIKPSGLLGAARAR